MNKQVLSFLYIAAVAFLASCQESSDSWTNSALQNEKTNGIIGGQVIPHNDLTSQRVVSIRIYFNPRIERINGKDQEMNDVKQCTGIPLDRELVLTAAHCFSGLSDTANVLRTVEFKNRTGKHLAYKITQFIQHPEYLRGNQKYDLAVVKVSKKMDESLIITPLLDHSVTNLKSVVAAGYGRTNGFWRDISGDGQNTLRSVALNLIDFSKDETLFKVDQKGGKGICQGDSGGPAFAKIAGQVYVVGIASKTTHNYPAGSTETFDRCADKGIFINVQQQFNAILSLTKKIQKGESL